MESGHRTYLFAHGVARRIDDVPTAAVRNSREAVIWSPNFAYAVGNPTLYSMHALRALGDRERCVFPVCCFLRRPTMPTPLMSEQAGFEANIIHSLDRLLIALEAPPTSHPERVCGPTTGREEGEWVVHHGI